MWRYYAKRPPASTRGLEVLLDDRLDAVGVKAGPVLDQSASSLVFVLGLDRVNYRGRLVSEPLDERQGVCVFCDVDRRVLQAALIEQPLGRGALDARRLGVQGDGCCLVSQLSAPVGCDRRGR